MTPRRVCSDCKVKVTAEGGMIDGSLAIALGDTCEIHRVGAPPQSSSVVLVPVGYTDHEADALELAHRERLREVEAMPLPPLTLTNLAASLLCSWSRGDGGASATPEMAASAVSLAAELLAQTKGK